MIGCGSNNKCQISGRLVLGGYAEFVSLVAQIGVKRDLCHNIYCFKIVIVVADLSLWQDVQSMFVLFAIHNWLHF